MQPQQLTAPSFASYPPKARAFATQNLSLLQQMPLPLAIIQLREVISYDFRFPVEQRMLDDQFSWLHSLAPADRQQTMGAFAGLTVPPEIAAQPWFAQPQQASEQLTAHLWSTHQMDAFHTAAGSFAAALNHGVPEKPPATPRLCMVVVGRAVQSAGYPLFRKLRPHGVFFPRVEPAAGPQAFFDQISARVALAPEPYQHWFIDGEPDAQQAEVLNPLLAHVSWTETGVLRGAVLARMQQVIQSRGGGPEQLRTVLAATTPADVGLASGKDEVLSRFKLSLLTEGSGTQIFSTTFAQWAAREVQRRAQPSTVLVRFGPRQRQLPMDELVAGVSNAINDPAGSLVDADMGAFYTWINQQRLPGAEQAKFIAWSQEHNQAIVLGAGLPRGTTAAGPMSVPQLLDL